MAHNQYFLKTRVTGGLVVSVFDCVPRQAVSLSLPRTGKLTTLTSPQVTHDWVIKGLGMSSRVCVTGHMKDPVLLVEKSRALSWWWVSF